LSSLKKKKTFSYVSAEALANSFLKELALEHAPVHVTL
jgi:hypothetical protein